MVDGEYRYARQKHAYGKLGKLEIVLVVSAGYDSKEMVHSFCCAGGQVQPTSNFVFYGKVPMLSHAEVVQEPGIESQKKIRDAAWDDPW